MKEKLMAIASYMGYKTWIADNGNIMAENAEGGAGHIDSMCLPFQYHTKIELLYPVAGKVVKELREMHSGKATMCVCDIEDANSLFESPPTTLFEAVFEGAKFLNQFSPPQNQPK